METAAELVRDVGVYRLGGYDGCPCTSFEVLGIAVDVSCRKSSGMQSVNPNFFGIGIRVTSQHIDSTPGVLEAVAREVADQLKDEGYAIMVRYCSYEEDAARKCSYCGGERTAGEYLCEQCQKKNNPFGESVADKYRFSFVGFPEPDSLPSPNIVG